MKKIIPVPYYSQFVDIDDCYWNTRSCGVTCLKMVFDFKRASTLPLSGLVKKAVDLGAYGKNGWIHDKLLKLAKVFGVSMYRQEKMDLEAGVKKIKSEIENNQPVVVSVVKKLFNQKKFHMVVMTGVYYDKNGELSGFIYHDPESNNKEKGQNLEVNLETFAKYWRNMALFLC